MLTRDRQINRFLVTISPKCSYRLQHYRPSRYSMYIYWETGQYAILFSVLWLVRSYSLFSLPATWLGRSCWTRVVMSLWRTLRSTWLRRERRSLLERFLSTSTRYTRWEALNLCASPGQSVVHFRLGQQWAQWVWLGNVYNVYEGGWTSFAHLNWLWWWQVRRWSKRLVERSFE